MDSSRPTPFVGDEGNRKRAPFGEAPRDIGNRLPRNKIMIGNEKATPEVSLRKQRPNPGNRKISHENSFVAPTRRDVALAISAVRSGNRQRQTSNSTSVSGSRQNTTVNDAPKQKFQVENRARIYKSEAYEAKIRIASQEQRIDSLKAELAEVKLFQEVESQTGKNLAFLEEKHYKDKVLSDEAKSILAFERPLEPEQKDHIQAKISSTKPEEDFITTKMKDAITGNDQGDMRSRLPLEWEEYIADLLKEKLEVKEAQFEQQAERQNEELTKYKNNAAEGLLIMKELEKTLKATRLERDQALSDLSIARAERDKIQAELDEARPTGAKYKNLEQSHAELQKVLEVVQSQSEKKMEKMKQTLKDAHDREEKLEEDHKNLVERYEDQLKESQEMELALAEIADKFEEQKKELEKTEMNLREIEETYTINLANLRTQHQMEIERKTNLLTTQATSKYERAQQKYEMELAEKDKEHEIELEKLKSQHEADITAKEDLMKSREICWQTKQQEFQILIDNSEASVNDLNDELVSAQSKCKAFAALESNYQSEIKSLKATIKELEQCVSDEQAAGDRREALLSGLRTEVAKFQTDKEELLCKLDRSVSAQRKMATELSRKESELTELRSLHSGDTTSESKQIKLLRCELDSKLKQKEDELEELQVRIKSLSKGKNVPSQTETELQTMNKKLKQDLLSAVESSISRAKTIQSLEKELESYQTKVTKLSQKIKRIEKVGLQTSATSACTDEEKNKLTSEISSLRTKNWEAQDTITGLRHELSLMSSKLSLG